MDINREVEDVIVKFPTLSYNQEKKELSGELPISETDSYEVLIDLNPFPRLFPIVYETEERILRKPYRHIYSDTGTCCFMPLSKSQVLLKTKIRSVLDFIREIMVPYFQNNSFYELNGIYKTDEHSHTRFGIIEGYQDILRIENPYRIVEIIKNRILGKKLKIHDPCFCGSGRKMKSCQNGKHDKSYRDFKLIDKELLYHDLEVIVELLKSKL